MRLNHLEKIREQLQQKAISLHLSIPGLWKGNLVGRPEKVDYCKFLITKFDEIINSSNIPIYTDYSWTSKAVIYNLFVRFFSAYDHDQDGIIGESKTDLTCNNDGIRETGTFIKTIALLPYLKQLGINTIHLLPITEIGNKGRKGDLGSPYAIKDPFKIDPLLADPIVDFSVEDQYKALIEAAHHLGIRVVQEFIFRTASIDSAWVVTHPDWFYWIRKAKNYGPPKFTARELKQILKVPKGKGKYIPPHKSYRALFDIPAVGKENKSSEIASAFADWPPDDLQPPWSDVTYLRLYHYPYQRNNNYNYIAYNTIRFYDPELANEKNVNRELWNEIAKIIPYYQQNFGIDGAMIDMGHALPNQLKHMIIEKARNVDPAFAFWDENFDNKETTKKEGYDAVIGDTWYKISRRNGFRNMIKHGLEPQPLYNFGAAETHNSPRLTNEKKKRAAWILFNILPYTTPFLHNGFELDEHLPVNTGLNFTRQQLTKLSREKLALFCKASLNWDSKNIVSFIRKIAQLIDSYSWVFDVDGLTLLETSNKKILGFHKKAKRKESMILFNTNFYRKECCILTISNSSGVLLDLLEEKPIGTNGTITLKPGQVVIGIYGSPKKTR